MAGHRQWLVWWWAGMVVTVFEKLSSTTLKKAQLTERMAAFS